MREISLESIFNVRQRNLEEIIAAMFAADVFTSDQINIKFHHESRSLFHHAEPHRVSRGMETRTDHYCSRFSIEYRGHLSSRPCVVEEYWSCTDLSVARRFY